MELNEGVTQQKKTKGLLYPAFHKLYSALNNLEKFEKGSNFFDNISYLDNFFSEYRNVTFMIQKSLANTDYMKIYEENRQKYLINDICKWFIEKRNEVLKQEPFNLEKKIRIVIYDTCDNYVLPEMSFTIENDVEYTTLIDSMKDFFASFKLLEVMFSAEFSFYEKGSSVDLYDNIIAGINKVKLFMKAMKQGINENCSLSKELEEKIDKLNFDRVPRNMLLTDDYLYYFKSNSFERASRAELSLGLNNPKAPLSGLANMFPKSKNIFESFILMHLTIFKMQNKTIMPTCFLVFNDGTMQFISFNSSIKTTLYRKLYEIANRIEKEGITAVYYVGEMYNYYNVEQALRMESRERIKNNNGESLVFCETKDDLTTSTYSFDSEKIDQMNYIITVLNSEANTTDNLRFMTPVIKEFKRLNKEKEG